MSHVRRVTEGVVVVCRVVVGGGGYGAWEQKGRSGKLKPETQKSMLTKLAESQALHGSSPPLILTNF